MKGKSRRFWYAFTITVLCLIAVDELWNLKNNKESMNNIGRGGDAGDIFVAARNIEGSGSFEARGGDGSVGGKGGNVTLITDNNQFSGIIDVQGGRSVNQEQELERPWYKSWWMEYVVYPLLVGVVLIVLGFIFSKFLK